ncbi:hypothetical protein [Natrialba sp. PRR66]|uniref:hypothetical protein n=1 Tax=Natrialba sp. PRR66 TaxID=3098146 RepID=UPI002B1D288B|nr:hypothetical protein [Natrialba sp. PRR66]
MSWQNRYTLKNFFRAVRNPKLFLGELNSQYYDAALLLNKRFYERSYDGGTDVFEEDWDNLFILDGCRFDVFDRCNDLSGNLEHRISHGSESWEFLSHNFGSRDCHDTVYVTANPHWHKLPDDTFHAVIDLLRDAWDDKVGTVRPSAVVERAVKAHKMYPNKRLIVHFMQPHFPFIGYHGDGLNHKGITIHLDDDASDAPNVWEAARRGEVDIGRVRRAYSENLDIVLNHVRDLLTKLNGKTVVTSDHGNLVGDELRPIPVRGFGHPRGLYAPPLVKVPWFIVETGQQRKVMSESPVKTAETDDEIVSNRLEALGYRE